MRNGPIEIGGELPIHASWSYRSSPVTLCTFSAAITRRTAETVPVFSGYRTTRNVQANILRISDPSLLLDSRLNLGWYAGSYVQPDLQELLTRLVSSVTNGSRTVLFGASGGGFAALEMAPRLPGSTALVLNPQTDITKYSGYRPYKKYCWPDLGPLAIPPVRTSILDTYAKPCGSNVIYVQNTGDESHMKNHYAPFIEAVHPDNNVYCLMAELGAGHVGPVPADVTRLFGLVTGTSIWSDTVLALSQLNLESRNG